VPVPCRQQCHLPGHGHNSILQCHMRKSSTPTCHISNGAIPLQIFRNCSILCLMFPSREKCKMHSGYRCAFLRTAHGSGRNKLVKRCTHNITFYINITMSCMVRAQTTNPPVFTGTVLFSQWSLCLLVPSQLCHASEGLARLS
jgi:hypothetical protein